MAYIHKIIAAIPDWPDPDFDPDWVYSPWLFKLRDTLMNLGATIDFSWADGEADEEGYKTREDGGRFWSRGGVHLPTGAIRINKRTSQREGTRGELMVLAHEGGHWMEFRRGLYDPKTDADHAERAAYLYGWGLLSLIGATAPGGPVSKADWREHHCHNSDIGNLFVEAFGQGDA